MGFHGEWLHLDLPGLVVKEFEHTNPSVKVNELLFSLVIMFPKLLSALLRISQCGFEGYARG